MQPPDARGSFRLSNQIAFIQDDEVGSRDLRGLKIGKSFVLLGHNGVIKIERIDNADDPAVGQQTAHVRGIRRSRNLDQHPIETFVPGQLLYFLCLPIDFSIGRNFQNRCRLERRMAPQSPRIACTSRFNSPMCSRLKSPPELTLAHSLRKWCTSEVFPAPRKPPTSVTGNGRFIGQR